MSKNVDVLVVGAGLSGATVAERLTKAGKTVCVVDKRNHVAGNAFDEFNADGVFVHRYGPHLFHTNSPRVYNYLSHFTGWLLYELRVLSCVDGRYYPFPINRTTINRVFGKHFTLDSEVEAFLKERVGPDRAPQTSEDVVLSRVGPDLCSMFYDGYTKKQWGRTLKELHPSVAARIPVRFSDDDRYFEDAYQCLPSLGYAKMVETMLANVPVQLGTEYRPSFNPRAERAYKVLVYTGRIDDYYENRFGRLPYRSLAFKELQVDSEPTLQPAAIVNYPNDYDFTRSVEYRQITGQKYTSTSIVREYPTDDGPPFYPIPSPESDEVFKKYWNLAEKEKGVYFLGRLARYKYLNMDQAVLEALDTAEQILKDMEAK